MWSAFVSEIRNIYDKINIYKSEKDPKKRVKFIDPIPTIDNIRKRPKSAPVTTDDIKSFVRASVLKRWTNDEKHFLLNPGVEFYSGAGVSEMTYQFDGFSPLIWTSVPNEAKGLRESISNFISYLAFCCKDIPWNSVTVDSSHLTLFETLVKYPSFEKVVKTTRPGRRGQPLTVEDRVQVHTKPQEWKKLSNTPRFSLELLEQRLEKIQTFVQMKNNLKQLDLTQINKSDVLKLNNSLTEAIAEFHLFRKFVQQRRSRVDKIATHYLSEDAYKDYSENYHNKPYWYNFEFLDPKEKWDIRIEDLVREIKAEDEYFIYRRLRPNDRSHLEIQIGALEDNRFHLLKSREKTLSAVETSEE